MRYVCKPGLCAILGLAIILLIATAVTAETPKYGGILNIEMGASSPTRLCFQEKSGVEERILGLVGEGLVRYHFSEDKEMEIVPWLAEAWEEGDKEITFYLRQGVKFHNGREMVADDIVYVFEKMQSNDPPSQDSFILATMDKIEAVDDYTVHITFKEHFAPFLDFVGRIWIYPPETWPTMRENPTGTGPFKFKEHEIDHYVLLERFDDYWQEGLPYLDGVRFNVHPDHITSLIAFKQKETDVMIRVTLPLPELKALLEDPEVRQYGGVAPVFYYVCLNNLFPPTSDPLVRKAIAHCVNRKVINQVMYGGLLEEAYYYLPPDNWAFNPEMRLPEYDIDKARELFKEAGVDKLVLKPFPRAMNPIFFQMIEMVAAGVEMAGVKVEWEIMERARWVAAIAPEPQEPWAFWCYPNTRLPDPDHYMASVMLNVPSYSGYRNEYVQKTLREKAVAQTTREGRKEVYDEMQRILVEEDIPVIPILWDRVGSFAHSYVRDLDTPYINLWFYGERAWLDK